MLRRLGTLGVVSLGVMCMAIKPRDPAPQPPPAPVPTSKKVVTTPKPPPPAPTTSAPSPGPASPLMPPAAPPVAPVLSNVERARQGVVVLERAGKPLALGFVIDGDGRILTALSPLTNGNFLSARYHDGVVIPLKLTLGDRGWDLALLTPVSTVAQPLRKAGLRAAKLPSFLGIQSFNLTPPNTLTAAPATLTLSPTLLGGDATTLANAYVLGSNKPALVGGPIFSAEGEVIALVARACPAESKPGCVPAPYAAPVPALKQFLQRVPSEATWLGVDVAHDETRGVHGVRVVSVIPNSPAAMAGIRPGAEAVMADLIVAVDGTPVTSPGELNEAVRARTTGDTIDLLLFGLGRYRQVTVKPRPAPQLTAPPYAAPKPGKPRTPNPYR